MTVDLTEQSYELLFGLRRSARYHEHRSRFYGVWTALTISVSLLGGVLVTSTSIAYASSTPELPAAFGGLITLVNVVSLAFGASRRASLHATLVSSFVQLESRFPPSLQLTEDELKDITRERSVIEKTEPPVLRLLDVLCHFEILRSMGYQYDKPKISRCRRILARLLSQADFAVTVGNGNPR